MIRVLLLLIICQFGSLSCIGQLNVDSVLAICQSSSDENVLLINYTKLIQYYKYKDLEKVKLFSTRIYSLENVEGPAYAKATADYYLGFYHKSKGNREQAVDLFTKAMLYGESYDDFSFVSSCKTNLAIMLQEEGNSLEAIEIYQELIDLSVERNDESEALFPYNNIGLLYESMNNREKAYQNYKRAHQIALKYDDLYNVNLTAGNLANTLTNQGILDSASHYAMICKQVAEANNFRTSKAYADFLFANIYEKKGQLDSAVIFAETSLQAFDSLNFASLYINSAMSLGGIYIKLNKFDQAISMAKDLLAKSEKVDHIVGQKEAYNILMKGYEQVGDAKNAYQNAIAYQTFTDSVSNKQKAESIHELELKYETARKDSEIANQTLEIVRQAKIRSYLIGGLVGIGLLSLLFLNHFRNRQKIIKNELELKQKKIDNLEQAQKMLAMDLVLQGQEEERKRIAKDLHDGLGGLLATARLQLRQISSSRHQTHNGKDVLQAEQIIESAYSEVRRIAHDMMPSALENLGFRYAVEDLADKINSTNQLQVLVQFFVQDLNIANSLEIALYRIVQEALNNSIKHAQAKQAIIQVSEQTHHIHLTIEDDGIGFNQGEMQNSQSLGLKNIESRVKYLNGTMSLETKPGQGVSYDILIPKTIDSGSLL